MYHLFAGDSYYPGGGLSDYLGAFPTWEAAEAKGAGFDWHEVAVLGDDGELQRFETPPQRAEREELERKAAEHRARWLAVEREDEEARRLVDGIHMLTVLEWGGPTPTS